MKRKMCVSEIIFYTCIETYDFYVQCVKILNLLLNILILFLIAFIRIVKNPNSEVFI